MHTNKQTYALSYAHNLNQLEMKAALVKAIENGSIQGEHNTYEDGTDVVEFFFT